MAWAGLRLVPSSRLVASETRVWMDTADQWTLDNREGRRGAPRGSHGRGCQGHGHVSAPLPTGRSRGDVGPYAGIARARQAASVTDAIQGQSAHIRRVWRTRTEPGQSAAVTQQTVPRKCEIARKVGGVDGTRTRGLRRDRPDSVTTHTDWHRLLPKKTPLPPNSFRAEL